MQFYVVVSSSDEDGADVITAEQFNEAVIKSGRTMLELANLIGVSRSMVHAYRNQGVTRPRTVEQVRRVMALWLSDDRGNPYDGYTDDDLVREISRRLNRIRDLLDQSAGDLGSESSDTPDDASGDGGGRYTGTGGPPDA